MNRISVRQAVRSRRFVRLIGAGLFGASTPAPVGALTYLGATLKLNGSTITYNPS